MVKSRNNDAYHPKGNLQVLTKGCEYGPTIVWDDDTINKLDELWWVTTRGGT
jgi:hypothetical protein